MKEKHSPKGARKLSRTTWRCFMTLAERYKNHIFFSFKCATKCYGPSNDLHKLSPARVPQLHGKFENTNRHLRSSRAGTNVKHC